MNNTDVIMVVLGIVFVVLFFLLRLTKVPGQLYKSEAVYSDHRKEKPEKALVSNKHGLWESLIIFYILTKDGLLPSEIKH